MFNKLYQPKKQNNVSKFFKSVALTGGMLLFILKPGISKGNEDLKAELQKVLKEHSVTEWKIQESKQDDNRTAKFEAIQDTITDPYDQIREYVSPADTAYFSQLKRHMETKDQNEQIKCKAVVYAILQDTLLTADQKKTLSLAQFEKLAKMPGSDYRFLKKSSAITTTDAKYKERSQRYSAYKSYLELLDIQQEIKDLRQENDLLKKLLDGYNKK